MPQAPDSAPPPLALRVLGLLVRVLLPVAVLLGGGWAAKQLMESGPEAKRRSPKRRARLVEVVPAVRIDHTTVIDVMGTVRPAREVVLKARTEGEVLDVSAAYVPGASIAKDTLILSLDPRDYELAVKERESELAKVRADLAVERGNQIIAKRESELLGGDLKEEDRELLLRKPQLAIAEAAVAKAEAALDAAKLELARTRVTAPFNAVVGERMVDRGTQVTRGAPLVQLVGTDRYWVEVSVPVDQLRWIETPGASATILHESAWGTGKSRTGKVVSLLSDLEASGRMARLLVAIETPLDDPPLLLDSYVRVRIAGRRLSGVIPVARRHLREGDRVWIMNADSLLEFRPLTIAFRERDRVLVSEGLEPGDRIVSSDLSSAVKGMPLRTAAAESK